MGIVPDGQSPLERVRERLKLTRPHRSGWVGRCPVPTHGRGCGDQHPSLSVAEGMDGRVLLTCHAGCTTEAVLDAIGFKKWDLFPRKCSPAFGSGLPRFVATYDYRKRLRLYQVVRYDPKTSAAAADGNGRWIWTSTHRKVLFRLPELVAADLRLGLHRGRRRMCRLWWPSASRLLRTCAARQACAPSIRSPSRPARRDSARQRWPGRRHAHAVASALRASEAPGSLSFEPRRRATTDWVGNGAPVTNCCAWLIRRNSGLQAGEGVSDPLEAPCLPRSS
jgi:hypothetical protein